MAGRPSLTRHNAAAPNAMSDRHPHSSRTGAPGHQRTYFTVKWSDGPRQREFLPPRAYAVVREQKDLLEKTLNDSSSLSQQHLVSVLRKTQAGTSALMVTEEAMMTDAMQQSGLDDGSYNDDYDDTTDHDPSPGASEPPSSLSSGALHILQALETSGFEGTPTEESDAINSLIDQLPLSNFMTEVESVDDLWCPCSAFTV